MADITEKDIDNIVEMLDKLAMSGSGRMKVSVSGSQEAETFTKTYHHGRCDMASPAVKGPCG